VNPPIIHILLIEDNPGDVRLLAEYLKEDTSTHYELHSEGLLKAGLDYLANAKVEIILLDLSLPDSQGYDTFTKINNRFPQIPIVVLTGMSDNALALQAVKAGAQDYLVKGKASGDFLARTIRYSIQRKKAEVALQEKVEDLRRMATVVSDSNDAVILHDFDGKILAWNRGAKETYGYSEAEALKMNVRDIVAEPDREAALTLIKKIKLGEVVKSFELRRVTKDDRILDVWLTTTLLTDEKGKPVAIATTERDITERKKAEEITHRNETMLLEMGKMAKLGGWALDLQTNSLMWTLETYHIHEIDPSTIPDLENAINFYSPEARPIITEAVRQAIEENKSFDLELPFITARSHHLWVRSIGKPNYQDGKCTRISGSFQDITERKQAEGERLARVAAEQANAAKSEFLSQMSHELRTPLNAINGFSEVLLEKYFGELNQKQEGYLHDILESGNHLLSLINDILDISKIEAGKETLQLTPVDISGLLENSIVMIKGKATKQNIEIDIQIPKNLNNFQILIDQRKIKQVMYNLLSNAIKFTPDEGRITIKAAKLNDEITISVSDTGIGLSKEEQKKVFEEFYQVVNDQDGKPEGTGLGLSLVKRHVEMHGGKVWIESEGSGKGSKFIFTMPIKQNSYSQ
jgi:PAS domain S-box-containing protein